MWFLLILIIIGGVGFYLWKKHGAKEALVVIGAFFATVVAASADVLEAIKGLFGG